VAQGLILLALIAVLVTVFAVRIRGRLGLRSTPRTWTLIMLVFVIIVLALWAASH
jgi:hypothetical protein